MQPPVPDQSAWPNQHAWPSQPVWPSQQGPQYQPHSAQQYPQSQQPWAPPPGAPTNSPWAQQQAGYQPNFAPPGAPSRDPRAPIGGHVPAADAITNYQTARSRRPLIITVVVLALVAVAVLIGTRAFNRVSSTASSTSTTTTATVDEGNASGSNTSVPFDSGSASGVWSITKYSWSGNHLELTTSVTLSQGRLAPTFFALNNAQPNETYDPDGGTLRDGAAVTAGQPVTGTLTFSLPRGETTVFIANSNQRQITALVIPG